MHHEGSAPVRDQNMFTIQKKAHFYNNERIEGPRRDKIVDTS